MAPKADKKFFIGIAAGLLVGLLAGCCGGVAIGMNGSKPKPASTAAASIPPAASAQSASSGPAWPTAQSEPFSPAATPSRTAAATIVMPNVIGVNAAVAGDQLRKLGLTNIQYGSQDAKDTVVLLAANWTVTKQSTKAGAAVELDTLIVLTCTKAK